MNFSHFSLIEYDCCSCDILCWFHKLGFYYKCKNASHQGETVIGDNLIISPGGKGANQAVAASKAGSEVDSQLQLVMIKTVILHYKAF